MTRKTIFEWAELFQEEITQGASESDIIQLLVDYKKEQLNLSGVSCSASDVISKIKNLPESNFSQDGQLKLLRVCGNALGLYKAVKWMQKHYS